MLVYLAKSREIVKKSKIKGGQIKDIAVIDGMSKGYTIQMPKEFKMALTANNERSPVVILWIGDEIRWVDFMSDEEIVLAKLGEGIKQKSK